MRRTAVAVVPAALVAVLVAACAASPGARPSPATPQTLYVVNDANRLIAIDALRPGQALGDRALAGLQPGERILGIDYRVARGQLLALGSSGLLYRIDTATATASQVGGVIAAPLRGNEFGVDLDPAIDRLRVVSDAGLNLRLDPDTGAVVDADPQADGLQLDAAPAWDPADRNAGRPASIVATACVPDRGDARTATCYAIDAARGLLALLGSTRGAGPVVPPQTGRLVTIGPLRAGSFERASFDVARGGDVAFVALARAFGGESVLYRIDLATGAATRIGPIAGGRAVAGIAIEP